MRTVSTLIANLTNAAFAVGLAGLAVAAEETAPSLQHYNAFSCVRPVYEDAVTVVDHDSLKLERVFKGYLPCHETYETDKNGFMIFPEA